LTIVNESKRIITTEKKHFRDLLKLRKEGQKKLAEKKQYQTLCNKKAAPDGCFN
jgi:hypothetical protein